MSEFTVNAGESVDFVMSYGPSHLNMPRAIDVNKSLQETQKFWEKWAADNNYQGPYQDAVERSLITLKALTYRPTGGIVAAVTTSLPEQLGGPRNWDYRLLLAARCDLHLAGFHVWRLLPGSQRVAAVVAARDCRQS